MSTNPSQNHDTGDGQPLQSAMAGHGQNHGQQHVVFKPSALQSVVVPDSAPEQQANGRSASASRSDRPSSPRPNTVGVLERVPLADPAPMHNIVAPTPQPYSGSAFAFTPMASGLPSSASMTPREPDAFSSVFEGGTASPVSLSRQTSMSSSHPASRIQSRRGSAYAPHPMATGPPARPPLRTGDSSAAIGGTPSLLSRAGSPTLPLMNEKTRSRSGSFVGSQGLGGDSLFGFSALRGSKKAGEFVGSVDCGTTSTRFIVFDKQGRIITEHQTEFEQIHPHPGWHEHSPNAILSSVEACIAKAVEKLEWMGYPASSIKVIGITNQRETTLCWDKQTGKAWDGTCNAIVWDDVRNVHLVRDFQKKLDEEGLEIYEDEELEAKRGQEPAEMINGGETAHESGQDHPANGILDKLMSGLGVSSALNSATTSVEVLRDPDGRVKIRRKGSDALKDITGIPLSTYFSAIKLRWMIEHHDVVKQAYDEDRLAFGTVDSWLVYNLTGAADHGIHVMDCTNASRTLLMDIRTLSWSPTLIRFFGLKSSVLPKIVSSSEEYGKIASGPLKGVPIAGLIGDQQAALVGNKCLSKGEAKNTYGTGAFVLFNTGHEVVRSREGLISTVGYKLGKEGKATYALEGSIAVAGSAIKWLRDQMGLIEESADMEDLCSSVKDCGGVYFVTAFSGLLAPYWDPNASGMIIGLTQYSTAAHIARAVLEAACYQTRSVLDVIEKESQVKLETLKVDGGVTNSDLAMQLQADIGGFKVCRPQMRESTALGSALLAGSAIGLFGWDLSKPETLEDVNSEEAMFFEPEITDAQRAKKIKGWERAVSRAAKWHTDEEEDEEEANYEKEDAGRLKRT